MQYTLSTCLLWARALLYSIAASSAFLPLYTPVSSASLPAVGLQLQPATKHRRLPPLVAASAMLATLSPGPLCLRKLMWWIGKVLSQELEYCQVSTRKLSNTIGWRTTPIPTQDVVEQGKSLCSQYIRSRLKRSGVFNRKCGLTRMRGAAGVPGSVIVRDVFPELASIGQELERMHPKLYTSVARQASPSPACGTLASEKTAGMILTAVARELFKSDVTWGKVVSLFAVAGGLAVDCVRQGHPEYLQALLEAMGEVLEEEMAPWIVGNGGWTALLTHCRPPNTEVSIASFLGVFAAVMVAVIALVFLARWFGKLAFL